VLIGWKLDTSERESSFIPIHASDVRIKRCRLALISWTKHGTNQSILDEMSSRHRFLTTIQRRKLKYFSHVVKAENHSTDHILHGHINMISDLEAGQNDAGQIMWKTSRFRGASRWTEQHGNPSCRHHWSSCFRNEEKPTTTTTWLNNLSK